MMRVRRKTKNNNFDKQKLLDSDVCKVCKKCGEEKPIRDFQLKQEYGRWYPLYVCKLCQSRLKNQKRKGNEKYKKSHAIRGHNRWQNGKEELKDFYVYKTLHLDMPLSKLRKEFPELIQLKKLSLQLRRKILSVHGST